MTDWLDGVPSVPSSSKKTLTMELLRAGGKFESHSLIAGIATFVLTILVLCLTRPPFVVWASASEEGSGSVPKLQWIVLLWGLLAGGIAALWFTFAEFHLGQFFLVCFEKKGKRTTYDYSCRSAQQRKHLLSELRIASAQHVPPVHATLVRRSSFLSLAAQGPCPARCPTDAGGQKVP